MDTEYLRSATRVKHEATEATVPLMDPMLTREGYATALRGMLRAVGPWDDWAVAHCPPVLASLLQGRTRSVLLRADLAYLGAPQGPATASPDAPWVSKEPTDAGEFEAMFLGAMYVVEGSTLGGQYIARHVEEVLHLQPGQGDAYFRGYGEDTGAMWKQFKAVLAAVPDQHTELVVESARRMFDFFAAQMTGEAPAPA